MREELTSLELLLACAVSDISSPGLFRFGSAETSFHGILLNDR